jgi:hypothetical protein
MRKESKEKRTRPNNKPNEAGGGRTGPDNQVTPLAYEYGPCGATWQARVGEAERTEGEGRNRGIKETVCGSGL